MCEMQSQRGIGRTSTNTEMLRKMNKKKNVTAQGTNNAWREVQRFAIDDSKDAGMQKKCMNKTSLLAENLKFGCSSNSLFSAVGSIARESWMIDKIPCLGDT